jgi:hypothetical protein
MKGRFVPQSHQDRLNYNSVVILFIEFVMNNIQELVIDKVKALSINQQKSVLYFIDRILSPNVINSDQELEKLLMEGVDSLERGEGIVTTDDWWEQEREHLISNSLNLLAK